MNREEFFETILKECEIEEKPDLDEILEDIESWDSLAYITVLSLYKKHFDKHVTISELKTCKTFNEVLNLGSDVYEK